MARNAGWQVPGSLLTATGVNAGGHLRCLAAMARRADDVGIGGDLPDSVTAMTGDARGAGAAAAQLGMSALRNLLMRREMACAATDRLGPFGVRPFRDIAMALGAGKRFVRGLKEIVGIVVTGQALLRRGRQLRDGRNSIRHCGQEKPNNEKASSHLSATRPNPVAVSRILTKAALC
jgi:hypothetical protein